MHIKQITNQNRRDFHAIYECEHCNNTFEGGGYDDAYFHQHVIPNMTCKVCGKQAGENYFALTPKYPEGMQV